MTSTSVRKTIMIDSTYRDRLLYPNPAEFILPYQALVGNTILTSRNPVTLAYPIYSWQWSYANAIFSGPNQIIIGGTPSKPIVALTPEFISLMNLSESTTTSATTFGNAQNMFQNLFFIVGTTTYAILQYDAIYQMFTLDKNIVNFTIGETYSIVNPSTSSLITLQGYNFTYLGDGSNNTGYSVTTTSSLWLWDMTVNQLSSCLFLDQQLQISVPFTGWKPNDVYFLFSQQSPTVIDSLVSLGFVIDSMNNIFDLEVQQGSVITPIHIVIPIGVNWTSSLLAEYMSSVLSQTVCTVTVNMATAVFSFTSIDPTLISFRILSTSTSLAFFGYPQVSVTFETSLVSSSSVPWNQIAQFVGVRSISQWTIDQWIETVVTGGRVLYALDREGKGDAEFVISFGKSILMTNPGTQYTAGKTYYLCTAEWIGSSNALENAVVIITIQETCPVICTTFSSELMMNMLNSQYLFLPLWSPLFKMERYVNDTKTVEYGLFTNFTGSFPPPSPKNNESTQLLQTYAYYGVQPILQTIHGYHQLLKQNVLYIQLRQIDPLQLSRLELVVPRMYTSVNGTVTVTPFGTVGIRTAIIPFTLDSFNPLEYTGSTVSQNQMICYHLEISSLILPNQQIDEPFGGLTSSYPYVYLEITNETASSSHNKHVLYSNNPNAITATFLLPISDVNNPATTKFIKLYSSGHQEIKFKPNDNLRFRVFFPNGRTFETTIKDYLPPLSPNPLLQLSMVMDIRRLSS